MSSDATPSVTSMREARAARARRAKAVASGPPLTTFVASWQLSLEAAAKSPQAVRGYLDSLRSLCRFLAEHDMPADAEGTDAPHIRAYLLHEEPRTSAVSAAHHFRNIRVFFGWLAAEGERENPNPMDRVEAPKVTKKAKAFFTDEEKAFFTDEELAALLKTCSGSSFADRRDTAIMRIFIDTGIRVSGLAGTITVAGVLATSTHSPPFGPE
jgi:integrase/recombinase XerD